MTYPIQEILKATYPEYVKTYGTDAHVDKIIQAIIQCKTPQMGTNRSICTSCEHNELHYNSCRNRHCPCCQALSKEMWIDKLKESTVDAPYFHAVFTVPHELNSLFLANKSVMYSLLYKASADTMTTLAQDEERLGAKIGFTSILHTWGSNLAFHPHIHMIVLGGGLKDNKQFIQVEKEFLFPIKVVSSLFKGKFLYGLKKLIIDGQVTHQMSEQELDLFFSLLYDKGWVPHIKKTFKQAKHTIKYLGRYTHNIAIANSRIIHYDKDTVTFKWNDYKSKSKDTMTLTALEFVRRFIMHILPRKFVKIRHYGILSNRCKNEAIPLIRDLNGGYFYKSELAGLTAPQIILKLYNVDVFKCPKCNEKTLVNAADYFNQLE